MLRKISSLDPASNRLLFKAEPPLTFLVTDRPKGIDWQDSVT